jgi:hypothetical protein
LQVSWDDSLCARYSSADGNQYFGWEDAHRDTARELADKSRELADKFIERFPVIARLGQGQDWAYAGWYVQMMGLVERGAFPIAYADWEFSEDSASLPTTGSPKETLPVPPGGDGE